MLNIFSSRQTMKIPCEAPVIESHCHPVGVSITSAPPSPAGGVAHLGLVLLPLQQAPVLLLFSTLAVSTGT